MRRALAILACSLLSVADASSSVFNILLVVEITRPTGCAARAAGTATGDGEPTSDGADTGLIGLIGDAVDTAAAAGAAAAAGFGVETIDGLGAAGDEGIESNSPKESPALLDTPP